MVRLKGKSESPSRRLRSAPTASRSCSHNRARPRSALGKKAQQLGQEIIQQRRHVQAGPDLLPISSTTWSFWAGFSAYRVWFAGVAYDLIADAQHRVAQVGGGGQGEF